LTLGVGPQILSAAPRTHRDELIPLLHDLHEEEPGHFLDLLKPLPQNLNRSLDLARSRFAFQYAAIVHSVLLRSATGYGELLVHPPCATGAKQCSPASLA